MVFICYISFLATYSLFSVLPSTFPSHIPLKLFQAKVPKELTGQLPNPVTSLSPHLCLPLCRSLHSEETSPWSPPPPHPPLLSWHSSLPSCCSFTSSLKCWCSEGHPPEHPCSHSPSSLWSVLSAPMSSVIHPLRVPAHLYSLELQILHFPSHISWYSSLQVVEPPQNSLLYKDWKGRS